MSIILSFCGCVYNEFLILFCCGFEHNTHNKIMIRSNTESDIGNLYYEDDENSSDNTSDSNASVSGSGIGAKVAAYAVNKFDSFGYLYGASRSSEKYVDCSAVTYRSYKHFGIDISGSSAGQYSWCKNNGKMIKESELQAGDLLLKSNHVELYIGNGKRFGAHTDNTNWDNQVSVKPYRSGYFTSFCRPTK